MIIEDERDLRRPRLGAGIGAALAGHLVAFVAGLINYAFFDPYDPRFNWFGAAIYISLFNPIVRNIEFALFLGCVVAAIALRRKRWSSFGKGLLIGWALGLLLVIGDLALIIQAFRGFKP